jgi:hypothetical protein
MYKYALLSFWPWSNIIAVNDCVNANLNFTLRNYYMFICSLFKDACSVVIQNIQRRMKGWQINDKLERMWKKAVVI